VYAPGVIDWARGVEQAAAFITTEDPVVDSIATRATAVARSLEPNPFAGRNVVNAAAIFDALTTLGVNYVPDPNAPYPSPAHRADAVDRINYPRQTLAKRAGDCDDTTVLLAALLGNVGIPTKLVDVPGHLFLLFDTGYHERDRLALGIEDGLLEVVGDGVWIPVETTELRQGFAEAWRIGAAKYAASQENHSLALVDVQGAQAQFESSLPAQEQPVPGIDSGALLRRLTADANTVAGWRAQYLEAHFPQASGTVDLSEDARDQLAHVDYLAGEIDNAVRQLETAAHDRPRSARVRNNLGDAHAARGEFAAAIADYRQALELDPADGGIWLNRGLLLQASGDTTAAAEDLAQGLTRSGSYVEACRLLGLPADDPEVKGSSTQARRAQTRRLLRATLGRIPNPDSLRSAGTASQPPPRKLKPIHSMSAASRGADTEDTDLRSFLYWRERE
jgi:tetratricopeptide (TPR) repeat protein